MDNNSSTLSGKYLPCSVIPIRKYGCSLKPKLSITRSITSKLCSPRLHLILSLFIFVTIDICDFNSALDALPDLPEPLLPSQEAGSAKEVSLCVACRLFIDSFNKGLEETARGKHEGGDTSWEERNLKSYQDSEVRLIEIQERLCEDVKGAGKAQCLSLAEDTESDVEHWWFKLRRKGVELYDFLCVSSLKRCCDADSFGPTCQPCKVDCSKHGACDGAGTRGGTGKCSCYSGYIGEYCDTCADDHYRIATSDDFACRKCDSACSGCYGPGQTNCTNCREGYYKHEVSGCIDINECDTGMDIEGRNKLCPGNKFCINTDGSYRCADCHISCSGCVAYGNDWCVHCAPGYEMDDNDQCRTIEEIEKLKSFDYIDAARYGKNTLSRYFFYIGVLAVSVMMFRSNLYVMYTFTFGFIVVMLVGEFNLIEEDTSTRSSRD